MEGQRISSLSMREAMETDGVDIGVRMVDDRASDLVMQQDL